MWVHFSNRSVNLAVVTNIKHVGNGKLELQFAGGSPFIATEEESVTIRYALSLMPKLDATQVPNLQGFIESTEQRYGSLPLNDESDDDDNEMRLPPH